MKNRKPLARTTPLRPTRCPECLKGRRKCAGCLKKGAQSREDGPESTPKRKTGIRRVGRSKAERERIYGTPERQAWLRSFACAGCNAPPREDIPHHLHHTQTGGMGRKADADTQVPVCPPCHRFIHDMGQKRFEAWKGVRLAVRAERLASAWKELAETGE